MNSFKGERVLVTGANGMLATDLIPVLLVREANILVSDLQFKREFKVPTVRLDITNADAVDALVLDWRPKVIFNCAAYTAVDKAESDKLNAYKVNAYGVANLARAAKKIESVIVHFSTDYVFGAVHTENKNGVKPFGEDHPTAPCGVYGASKALGEDFLREILPSSHLIIRTSWLHGVNGPNFVATMIKIGKERPEVNVVSDQIGSPTWSKWLAGITVELVERDTRGTVHASSVGGISWYEFAKEIFTAAKMETKVYPQTSEELKRPAPRPRYSVLSLGKLESLIGKSIPNWKDGLYEHLKCLGVRD